MTTALTRHSIAGRLRTVLLAGTLALGAMIPATPAMLASGDTGPVVTMSDQFDIDPAGGIEGLTAEVDADGDGVNLRQEPAHDAPVVMPLSEGTIVDLRIDHFDTVYDPDGITRWWPVAVGGHEGWVSGFYLSGPEAAAPTETAAPPAEATSPAAARSAVSRVAYDYTGSMVAEVSADGDGLVLRAGPDRDSDEVATIPDGALVDLRIDVADTVYDAAGTRWWPVAYEGQEGWVSGFYLIEPGTEAPAGEPERTPDVLFAAGDTVRVKTPSGRGLVVRVEPAPDADRLTSLHEEQAVRIVEGPVSFESSENGWYLIATDDLTGYVDGDLLVLVERAETPVPTEPAAPEAAFSAGDWAEIRTASGDGVDLRAGASENSDKSGFAPNQGLVEILSGPEDGWYEVRWDTQTGYIEGSLLVPAKAPSRAERPAEEPVATETPEPDTFKNGDYAKVSAGSGVGVNVREDASQDADRAGYLAADAVVKITDGPKRDGKGNAWYRVTDGSQSGWVRGDLIAPTSAPATEDAGETETPETQNAETGFILPLASYRFTQDYGCSNLGFYSYDPAFGCSVHDGVDLAAPAQTPIYAVGAGTVVASGWCDCGLGYYVEIDHGDGLHTIYGHMASQPYVAVNQKVAQGEVIGPVGSTGLSTGPHTHFMVRQDGVTQDPKNYLPPLG